MKICLLRPCSASFVGSLWLSSEKLCAAHPKEHKFHDMVFWPLLTSSDSKDAMTKDNNHATMCFIIITFILLISSVLQLKQLLPSHLESVACRGHHRRDATVNHNGLSKMQSMAFRIMFDGHVDPSGCDGI